MDKGQQRRLQGVLWDRSCNGHASLRTTEGPAAALGTRTGDCCQGGPGSSRNFKAGQAGQGSPHLWGPACLPHWLAPSPLGGQLGKSPLTSPLMSGWQRASSQAEESPQRKAGRGLCGLLVLFLLKQTSQQWGHLLGGDCKRGVSHKPSSGRATPSRAMKRGMRLSSSGPQWQEWLLNCP